MAEKLKKTRPRKIPIIEYSEDDKGILSFPRSEFLGETDIVIGAYGHAYLHRDFAGKRVKVLIYRDKKDKDKGKEEEKKEP